MDLPTIKNLICSVCVMVTMICVTETTMRMDCTWKKAPTGSRGKSKSSKEHIAQHLRIVVGASALLEKVRENFTQSGIPKALMPDPIVHLVQCICGQASTYT